MEDETKVLAIQNLAQQLDLIINAQQKLGLVLDDLSELDKSNVMRGQDHIICNCVKLGRKIDPMLALALAIQEKLWDFDYVSELFQQNPWCTTDEFDYSFEQYASRRTGRDPVTIGNWTRTARLWLLESVGPKEPVALIDPKTGLHVLEQKEGETKPITVEWDPFSIDFTKLLLTNKAAKDGRLNSVGFGLLANPETRWSDMRDYIHGLNPWSRKPIEEPHQLSYFLKQGALWVKKGGLSEIIGSLETNSENLLVREGVARLVRTFSIPIVI